MPNVIFREPSTEEFNAIEAHKFAGATFEPLLPNIFMMILLLWYIDRGFEKTNYSQLEISLMSAFSSVLATYLANTLSVLFVLGVRESWVASHSRKTNQPIGYAIQSPDEEDINRLKQIRNLPLLQISSCPFKITSPRQQFSKDLQVVGENELVTASYKLRDVTETKFSGISLGIFNSLSTSFACTIAFSGSNALFMGLFIGLIPINIFCSSKLLKAVVSMYSDIPGTQYTGHFFSKSLADFRQKENAVHNPLLAAAETLRNNV